MVYMGVDLHRRFCYLTALDARGQVLWQGQVANDAASLKDYFARWAEPVEVAVEACSFWPAFVDAIQSQVARIVLVHAQRVKAIASAKLKNDRVDSATLAHLLRTPLLPEAWMADLATRELRQATRLQVSLGRERTRWKNQVHAVLHQQGRRPPASDLFGKQGRKWLAEVNLPPMTRHAVDTYLSLIDQLQEKIQVEEKNLRARVRTDHRLRWLVTIPGLGPYSAALVLAEIGDIRRFPSNWQWYSYAGLVPRVRKSAERCWLVLST